MLSLKNEEVPYGVGKKQIMKQWSGKPVTDQFLIDEDYNVPDNKKDIKKVMQSEGTLRIEEIRKVDHYVKIHGKLMFKILYVTDEADEKMAELSGQFPFEEMVYTEEERGDWLIRSTRTDVTAVMIHSRKLNIKALVTFCATVDETEQIRLPVALDAEEVSVRKKTVRFLGLTVPLKKIHSGSRMSIPLPPTVRILASLIWYTMDVRGLDLKPEENVVKARGELSVFVLYGAEDTEAPVQWLEYSLPFSGEVECPDCTEELIPLIEASVMHQSLEAKPDVDGEERILVSDVVLELDMKFFREEEYDLITDVYTPIRECVPEGKNEVLERLLVRNFSRCRISDRIQVKETQGKVLQLCHSQGKVKIDKTRIVENGVQADGVVMLKILYIIGNDDMPFYSMEAMIPFSHMVEARGIRQDSCYQLKAKLEQLSAAMADGNEIEIRATVGLELLAVAREPVFIIEK